MSEASSNNPIKRIIKATTLVEPNEIRATVLSFLFVFTLFTAYFILRAARDSLASEWSRVDTSLLWTMTFFVSIVAVSVYGFVVSRARFNRIVPGAYLIFAMSFVGFYLGSQWVEDSVSVDKSFYVWLSVFSLFHASVFWSFMSGTFSKEQAPRLFAIIATGASTGGIVGPGIAGFLTEEIGFMNLLLVAAGLLLTTLPMISGLKTLKATDLGNEDLEADLSEAKRLGRNPFAGFLIFIRNPFLVAIGVFILMYVSMSTFVYMELREALAVFERAERAEIYARIDLAVNTLSIVVALFATGRFATRFGMPATLALIPLLMIAGWLVVAAVPLLIVLYGLQVFRRAGNYAVTRPGRETLYTIVDDETRYKAKPVIDIVVYRGGDMATAWFHTMLKEVFVLGLGGVALVAAALCGIWALSGVYLGRRYNEEKEQ